MEERRDVMRSDQTRFTGTPAVAEPLARALLELNAVTKQFGGLKAVEALTFKVYPGQIVSIIGPNGAGKTTVFNLITGLYRPSSCYIRLPGHSLLASSPATALLRSL